MTEMTSSAASETDRARNRGAGGRPAASAAARTRRMSSAPPPPGMWTSTRTTSGPVAAIPAAASSTSPAVPTTSTPPSNSLRTPDRTSGWSSTTKTLGPPAGASLISIPSRAAWRRRSSRLLLDPGGGSRDRERDRGAFTGGGADLGGPAVAAHPGLDGVDKTAPVGGHDGRVESPPPVPHEQRHPIGLDLEVDVDRVDAGVAGGVEGRFPAGHDEGAPGVVEEGVAHEDRVESYAVAVLHIVELPAQQRRHRARVGVSAPIGRDGPGPPDGVVEPGARSGAHTSELQSPC